MPSIKELIDEGSTLLVQSGVDSPRFDATQLLLHCLGADSPAELFLAPPPSPEQQARYRALLRRRAGREPLQYLLGFWEFYGRRFHVREGVLIPRPDTELLIDLSLQFFPPGAAPQILDLCSGSGAIAVTLALERPDATVDALELSTDALEVLRENIALHGAPVGVIGDDVITYHPSHPYDMIVSNPPYISGQEYALLQPEVLCEPRMALLAPQDGMYFYEAIIRRYRECLKPGGRLLLEAGSTQAQRIAALLRQNGYEEIEIHRDLAKIERAVCAIWNS
ncbi:peptide chain release factor N(5)-glutamine methyltransferase [Harryflintia acetispora]|uniref:peptide chain release factor N(5)-glutamine methyltransferase n=1 Tax=Harryflintia acetispora TaxID=1849041 RepID=UPI00189A4067|nr:peptide chain release factor N(5)-glutamine methyltransferase [Harryflintia acetispora]